MKNAGWVVPVMVFALLAFAGCTSDEAKRPVVPPAPAPAPIAVPQSAAATAFALVKESSGSVKCQRGLEAVPAPAGTVLRDNDVVFAEKDGYATLEFRNGTIVRMSPLTMLKVNDVLLAGRKTLDLGLIIGRIWIKAALLTGGQRLEVTAPTAVAGVRGTQFHAASAADGSLRIGVEEGVVEVRSRRAVKSVLMNQEIAVDALAGTDQAGAFKIEDWDRWLSGKRAEVAGDPVKVAMLYTPIVAAEGAAGSGLISKAESVFKEMNEAQGADRDGRRAAFTEAMDEVRNVQDQIEIQMEFLAKIMADMSANPAAKKDVRDAFESQLKKVKEQVKASQEESGRQLKALDTQARPAYAAVLPAPAPAPVKGAEPSRPKAVSTSAAGGGKPADSEPPRPLDMPKPRVNAANLAAMSAKTNEMIKEMAAGEVATGGGKKVAMVTEEKQPEPARAGGKTVEDFQKAFKEVELKLESISVQGELFDNPTRAGMVKKEAGRIAALIPGLKALAGDIDRRAKESNDAAEGKSLFAQGQKAHLLVKELEAKLQWCEAQAKHYNEMKAE